MKIIDKRNESTKQLTLGDLEPGECFTFNAAVGNAVWVKTDIEQCYDCAVICTRTWGTSYQARHERVTRVPSTLIIGSEDDE